MACTRSSEAHIYSYNVVLFNPARISVRQPEENKLVGVYFQFAGSIRWLGYHEPEGVVGLLLHQIIGQYYRNGGFSKGTVMH